MGKLVRVLASKATWSAPPEHEACKDFLSDAYKSAHTASGRLSLFKVADDESNVGTVIAALAAGPGKASLDIVDYCVFDETVLQELGIREHAVTGDTACEAVNLLHIDAEFTAFKLTEWIGKLIWGLGDIRRMRKFDVSVAIVSLVETDSCFGVRANMKIVDDARRMLSRAKPTLKK